MNEEINYFEAMISDEERARLPYLETIPQLLEKCRSDYAGQLAVADQQQRLTYEALVENVGRRRQLLAEKQIPEGGHVGVMCRNTVDAMCWFLAIPSSGRVLLMLPGSLNAQALAGVAKKFDLDAVVMEACFQPLAEGLSIPVIPAEACAETVAPAADVRKDTDAAIFFTGGTTGAPKGAVLSHGALMRGAHNGTYRPAGTVFGNRYILMLPMSHIFGAVCGFLGCLYTGSEIYGCQDVRSGIVSIPVIRPTSLVLVPGIVEIILNLARAKGVGFLGDLKTIICGAAPVPARLMSDFAKYGINLFAGYGMTEGANLTCANIDTDQKPHSMGKFYPGQEHKVVDGELWIRGDNLMKGYYKDPEQTALVLTEDGWLKTGDLVSFDEDGYITIVGRSKNLIILSNGENVSPEEIEDTFNQSGIIQDCLVKEGEMNGHAVLSIEILPLMPAFAGKTPEEIDAAIRAEVKRINAQLPGYKQVSRIVIRTEDFKRTGAMKIDRLHS